MPEAIRQAYCIVVTVSDKDEAQAFKISVVGRGPLRDDQEGPAVARAGYGDHGRRAAARVGRTTCGRAARPAGGSRTWPVRSPNSRTCRRCSSRRPSWRRWSRAACRARSCSSSRGRTGRSAPGGGRGRTTRRWPIRRWNWSCPRRPNWATSPAICWPRRSCPISGRAMRSRPRRAGLLQRQDRGAGGSRAASRSRCRSRRRRPTW